MFPSITEYNRTIQIHGSRAFITESDLEFIPSRTVPIKIFTFGSGAYAVVFKATHFQKTYAIRCFLSSAEEAISRSKIILDYLQDLKLDWKVNCVYLDNEIDIDGRTFPVVKMEWIEGLLINQFVTKHLNNPDVLSLLQSKIIAVNESMEAHSIGHGDIQCGNIIIKETKDDFNVKLIDYDGLYVPSLKGKIQVEKGRSEFQHPGRTPSFYNEKIDRFSFWIIICAIEALKYDKSLWLEVMQGGYNTLDNFLFKAEDFKSFNSSHLINRMYGLNQPSLTFYLNKISSFCSTTIDQVTPPELYTGHKFATNNTLLNSNGDQLSINSTPQGAVVLDALFQRLGITPMFIDKVKYNGKSIIVTYKGETKHVRIEDQNTDIQVDFVGTLNSVFNSSSNFFSPQQETNIEIPSAVQVEVVSSKQTKRDFTGPIVLFCFISIVFYIIYIAYTNPLTSNEPANNYAIGDTTMTDSAAITTIVDTTVADSTVLDTIISRNNVTEGASNINHRDANNQSATEAVKNFLTDLNDQDFSMAWNRTLNPTWEENGKDWFISANGFGDILKVVIDNVYQIKGDNETSLVYAGFYSERSGGSANCYYQNISLKMTLLDGQNYWMITDVIDTKQPERCELVNN